jgi:hypothetical protein
MVSTSGDEVEEASRGFRSHVKEPEKNTIANNHSALLAA